MNGKFLAIIVIAAVVAAAVGGYVLLTGDDDDHDIVLAVGTKNCYEPFWIADGKGFFDEEGVKVKILYVDGGGNATLQLLSGNADMTLVGADPAIRLFNETDDGVAIATIETAKAGESRDFAYPKDLGINIGNARTLLSEDGKSVRIFCGLDTTTGYYSGYLSYLKNELLSGNIDDDQYDLLKTVNDGSNGGGIKHVPFDQQIPALDNGSIQLICSGTNVQLAEETLANIEVASSPDSTTVVSCCVVIVTGDALEHKSEAITKMLRAFDKACAYIENPDTQEDAIKYCTDFYGSGSSWTETMQKNFFDSQYWDICMMKGVEEYFNFKAELLGHEDFDCSDRIVYDFLIEIHPDMNFIYNTAENALETYVPA